MADSSAPNLPVEKGNYDITAPVFAKGLVALLQPVVAECDERIQAVMHSQRELSKQLDVLSAELDRFMEVSRTPLIGAYIDKLLRAKERMIGINVMLGNIQLRLEALQRENSTLPPSKLPPITIPASSPSEPTKKILGVNQPQFLSSWISKAKALVPDTPPSPASSHTTTTTTTTTTTQPPAKPATASSAPVKPNEKEPEQEKKNEAVEVKKEDNNDVTEEIKLDDDGDKESIEKEDDTKGEGETGN